MIIPKVITVDNVTNEELRSSRFGYPSVGSQFSHRSSASNRREQHRCLYSNPSSTGTVVSPSHVGAAVSTPQSPDSRLSAEPDTPLSPDSRLHLAPPLLVPLFGLGCSSSSRVYPSIGQVQ
ncbi:hypothetical protein AAHA92_31492 [Salvia divinorum]|uniref:Uncharacterized protein n=1 Tax=Salvia divinorum TaxID=28513 RepID=A0ABD1FTN5_SALDI